MTTRHGLRTLLMTGAPDRPGALTRHLLSGRKTTVLRPLGGDGGEPLERAGERVLLVDDRGRSVAVADVTAAPVGPLAAVDEATRRADDPDCSTAEQWAAAQLARWRTAGLIGADATKDLPVVAVHLHVVGIETADQS